MTDDQIKALQEENETLRRALARMATYHDALMKQDEHMRNILPPAWLRYYLNK